MLTQEQIKFLKEGDPIVIHTTFIRIDSEGDIEFAAPISFDSHTTDYISSSRVSLPSEHGTSVPTPKYDPTRPFKEGDIVKRRTVDGRTDSDVPEDVDLTVKTSESKYGNVEVQKPNGRCIVTKAVFLNLITPVEEREPYTIECAISGKGTDWRIKKDGVIICAYSCAHPDAKASADFLRVLAAEESIPLSTINDVHEGTMKYLHRLKNVTANHD